MKSAMLVLPPMVAAYLGVWQVGRREEKMQMLEERERVMMAEDDAPSDVLFAARAGSDGSDGSDGESVREYTKVRVSGTYDEAKSLFVGPRPRSSMGITEAGHFMVTPMYVGGDVDRAVMVLRGWVPDSWKRSSDRAGEREGDGERTTATTTATTTIRGVVRFSEKPSRFVPENCPRQGDWYYIDVPAMARAMGLPASTKLVEIVDTGDELMQYGGKAKASAMDILAGKTTVRQINRERDEEQYPISKSIGDMRHFSVMPRDHLNYALTWFSLSGATSLLAWRVLFSRGR